MKRLKFSDSQNVDTVERVEANLGVPDIFVRWASAQQRFSKWSSKYGGMDVSMMSRVKELEEENCRFKKMYIEEKLSTVTTIHSV